MTPDAGSSRLVINRDGFLRDLQNAIDEAKTPATWLKIASAFLAIYAAGISVAGTHAWAWATIPATLVALIRAGLGAVLGQYVHEDVVRELVADNIVSKRPAPGEMFDRLQTQRRAAAKVPPSPAAAPPPAQDSRTGDTPPPTAAHP